MVDWFVVCTPLALLLLLGLVRFVGCGLDTRGIGPDDPIPDPPPPTTPSAYFNQINGELDLVGWWRLGETSGTLAKDEKTAHNGTYTTKPATVDDADSKGAPGTFTVGQNGLLDGDPAQKSVFVDGGCVEVGFAAALNPPAPSGFSVEAWAHPEWPAAESGFYRCVVTSRDDTAGTKLGYIIYAAPDPAPGGHYRWEAWVGTGTAWAMLAGEAVKVGLTSHLVATYDGTKLRLYVDGQLSHATVTNAPSEATVTYSPVTATRKLRIGAGASELEPPKYPFKGRIQDVAVYKKALTDTAVFTHSRIGNGL